MNWGCALLLEPRGTKLTFSSSRKKRRKSWQKLLVAACLCLGIGLIIVSLRSGQKDSQPPELPSDRAIIAHASSLPDDSFVPDTAGQAPKAGDTANTAKKNDQKPANTQSLPQKNNAPVAPKADLKSPPIDSSVGVAATAMFNLAQMPVTHGGVQPKTGHYTIVSSPITYSDNVAPEVIAAAEATTYIVIAGDILGKIAQKYGCTIAQIQIANRMTNDQIKIGQKLLIPKCQSGNAEQVVPLVPEDAAPVPTASRGKWWKRAGVNTTALPKLMAAEGFKPPQKFMALILEFTFDETRQVVTRERAFDYNGSSSLNSGWNPASAIKIFAAIAALRRIDELGFSSRAQVTFHGRQNYTTTVHELIEAAIINSNNIAYNRVAQLASFDKLHTELFTARFGITQTALNRGYELSKWQEMGENPSLRVAPAITLVEGNKKTTLPAANSKAASVCSSAACTSLQDLAESSRRLMLQEQLPAEESFNLKNDDLLMLRRAMRSPDRTRGTEMVDRFAAVFKDPRVKFYSKPGFSSDWFTDNAYIFDPTQNQAWIVVMSGYPGRHSLDDAATAIAKIIHSGKLKNIP